MTKNLRKFTLFSLLWSVPFFAVLHWAMFDSDKHGPLMVAAYVVYGIGLSIAGSQLGRRERQNIRYNLPMRYVWSAVISSTVVCAAWIIGWRQSELGFLVSYIALLAVAGVVLNFYAKGRIKDMPKDKLFQ